MKTYLRGRITVPNKDRCEDMMLGGTHNIEFTSLHCHPLKV